MTFVPQTTTENLPRQLQSHDAFPAIVYTDQGSHSIRFASSRGYTIALASSSDVRNSTSAVGAVSRSTHTTTLATRQTASLNKVHSHNSGKSAPNAQLSCVRKDIPAVFPVKQLTASMTAVRLVGCYCATIL